MAFITLNVQTDVASMRALSAICRFPFMFYFQTNKSRGGGSTTAGIVYSLLGVIGLQHPAVKSPGVVSKGS